MVISIRKHPVHQFHMNGVPAFLLLESLIHLEYFFFDRGFFRLFFTQFSLRLIRHGQQKLFSGSRPLPRNK